MTLFQFSADVKTGSMRSTPNQLTEASSGASGGGLMCTPEYQARHLWRFLGIHSSQLQPIMAILTLRNNEKFEIGWRHTDNPWWIDEPDVVEVPNPSWNGQHVWCPALSWVIMMVFKWKCGKMIQEMFFDTTQRSDLQIVRRYLRKYW